MNMNFVLSLSVFSCSCSVLDWALGQEWFDVDMLYEGVCQAIKHPVTLFGVMGHIRVKRGEIFALAQLVQPMASPRSVLE